VAAAVPADPDRVRDPAVAAAVSDARAAVPVAPAVVWPMAAPAAPARVRDRAATVVRVAAKPEPVAPLPALAMEPGVPMAAAERLARGPDRGVALLAE
jgi:hypothetical protein